MAVSSAFSIACSCSVAMGVHPLHREADSPNVASVSRPLGELSIAHHPDLSPTSSLVYRSSTGAAQTSTCLGHSRAVEEDTVPDTNRTDRRRRLDETSRTRKY